jgi:hypothetical protein
LELITLAFKPIKKHKTATLQMRFPTFLISAITFIAWFSSCQKEITPSTNDQRTSSSNSSFGRVKTYTEDVTASGQHLSNSYNISYDDSGRVISLISMSSPGDKSLYKYNTDNTFTMDIYASNKLSIHETFFINSFGLVDSTVQYNETNDTTTEKYLYNSAKQLIELDLYMSSILDSKTSYEYDANGNATKETTAGFVTTTNYTNFENNLDVGENYFYRNKNLPGKKTSDAYSSSFTYTFDSNNRLTVEKEEISNGDIVIRKYAY